MFVFCEVGTEVLSLGEFRDTRY